MKVCSTFLSIPVLYKITQATTCVRPFGSSMTDYLGNEDKTIYLAISPTVWCMRDEHLRLVLTFLVLVPLYLYALIPYATCRGDFRYAILGGAGFKSFWSHCAFRQASHVFKGALHWTPAFAFGTQARLLVVKIFLPVSTLWLAKKPDMQILCQLVMALMLWVSTLIWAPFSSKKTSAMWQDGMLALVLTAICSWVTVLFNDPFSATSGVVWIICMVVVAVVALVHACIVPGVSSRIMRYGPGS